MHIEKAIAIVSSIFFIRFKAWRVFIFANIVIINEICKICGFKMLLIFSALKNNYVLKHIFFVKIFGGLREVL